MDKPPEQTISELYVEWEKICKNLMQYGIRFYILKLKEEEIQGRLQYPVTGEIIFKVTQKPKLYPLEFFRPKPLPIYSPPPILPVRQQQQQQQQQNENLKKRKHQHIYTSTQDALLVTCGQRFGKIFFNYKDNSGLNGVKEILEKKFKIVLQEFNPLSSSCNYKELNKKLNEIYLKAMQEFLCQADYKNEWQRLREVNNKNHHYENNLRDGEIIQKYVLSKDKKIPGQDPEDSQFDESWEEIQDH